MVELLGSLLAKYCTGQFWWLSFFVNRLHGLRKCNVVDLRPGLSGLFAPRHSRCERAAAHVQQHHNFVVAVFESLSTHQSTGCCRQLGISDFVFEPAGNYLAVGWVLSFRKKVTSVC